MDCTQTQAWWWAQGALTILVGCAIVIGAVALTAARRNRLLIRRVEDHIRQSVEKGRK